MSNKTPHEHLRDLERIAQWMDAKFLIPGTPIRFGLDSLIGLLPVVGDSSTLLVALYLTAKARALDLPKHIHLQMYFNAFIDWLIGLIPFLGDIFDIGFKANLRNVALIRKHIEEKYGRTDLPE